MKLELGDGADDVDVRCGRRKITVTHLNKIFWPELRKTKRDLLLYYATVSEFLLPHLKDRAVVMKRYPNGIHEKFFFMKRTPSYHPDWLEMCSITHRSASVIDFPMLQDLASLLWIVNLGCIDLNQWYARCDDTDRPDYLHFDLDPVAPAGFREIQEAALVIRDELLSRKVQSYPKTTGSRGIHIYVPLQRKPTQKEVWQVAKRMAISLAKKHPQLLTSEYRISKRPPGRVLVDYNQNAWGRTLASVYSVRPVPAATVSTPITWKELETGIAMTDFTMDSVPWRLEKVGDLFKPLLKASCQHPIEVLM